MEELQVIVKQEPGNASWNFDQLKAALADGVKQYECMVYTEATIKTAKADRAMLNKLKASVDARRKEIRAKCLEPYMDIERQAKELTGIIDRPIAMIDAQLAEYENARREEARRKIFDYMHSAFSELPADIAKKLECSIYDPRWENITASAAEWQGVIKRAAETTANDLGVLGDIEEEFRCEAYAEYGIRLVLSDAMSKVLYLRKQKEAILAREAERKRMEEEARVAAQKATEPTAETVRTSAAPEPETREPAAVCAPQTAASDAPELHTILYRVTGTKKQQNDIFRFIRSTGSSFKWKEENDV